MLLQFGGLLAFFVFAICVIALDTECYFFCLNLCKESNLKILCKMWRFDEKTAIPNFQNYLQFMEECLDKVELERKPIIYGCSFLERNSMNAGTKKGNVYLEPGILKSILQRNRDYDYALCTTGHELVHLKYKDNKKGMSRIEKMKVEVRADIEGRIIIGEQKENVAEIIERVKGKSKDYNKSRQGYPSWSNRIKYLRKYDVYNEALEKEIEKDYLNKKIKILPSNIKLQLKK